MQPPIEEERTIEKGKRQLYSFSHAIMPIRYMDRRTISSSPPVQKVLYGNNAETTEFQGSAGK